MWMLAIVLRIRLLALVCTEVEERVAEKPESPMVGVAEPPARLATSSSTGSSPSERATARSTPLIARCCSRTSSS
jgi:hypothetical protein